MDIRKKFLDFFKSKGHKIVESSPLVPEDASLLFTNAGMVQFKDIFIGDAPIPNPPRATSSQLCIRAGGKHNDLDNVGYTARHHTLFEMLGNFSFADYFKDKAIAYSWEFVTSKEYLNLPIDRLWVTIHNSDDEAFNIWSKYISKDRILRFGDKDNFWQMGDTGPCGPCSEIFYDQGKEHFNSSDDVMGGDGDRFLEIWNLVFMQYERDKSGNLTPLPKPSIDTGMGLERVVAIKEGVFSNYHSSLFMPYLKKIGELIGREYNPNLKDGASYRVVADHLRSVSFLLAQGVNFDREGRGYVLRRILRRAVRHGYLLGFREPFIYKLVDTLVDVMGDEYNYLETKAEAIKSAMRQEEERFFSTIEAGIELFNRELKNTEDIFSGEVAFKLYDTYGFPLDLTQDMLREKGIQLDIETFNIKMQEQREKSKASWRGSGDSIVKGDFKLIKEKFGENRFIGYDSTQTTATVLALLDKNFKLVDSIEDGVGWVFLDETPFYAESGGQIGDRGEILGKAKVLDTKRFLGLNLSKFKGSLSVGDRVEALVDSSRAEIAKHHSATHLLHAGLREILGEHITQAGSLNSEKRLRFDFSHPKPLTKDEIKAVEKWVNSKILRAIPRVTQVMNIDEAKESGAVALFGEKYGDRVRVVQMGESIELCGGTHIDNTSQIGIFIILKESGVSAGVRRIEAICGKSALEYIESLRDELEDIKATLKNQNPIIGIEKLKEQIKELKSEVKSLQNSTKKELKPIKIKDVDVIVDEVESGDIKSIIDEAKNRYPKIAIMLFQKKGDRVLLASGVKGVDTIKAGDWIREIAPILGGGGGGRADFAQAGGKDTSKIKEAKERALGYLKNRI